MDIPKTSKLWRVTRTAQRRNQTVEELIVSLITEKKSTVRVANALNVSPHAVRYHLEKLGYAYTDGEWRKAKASTP